MSEPSDNSNGRRPRIRFNPEVTLGHVLQLASFFAVVTAMWFNMDKRIASIELRQDFATEERREMKRVLNALSETRMTTCSNSAGGREPPIQKRDCGSRHEIFRLPAIQSVDVGSLVASRNNVRTIADSEVSP